MRQTEQLDNIRLWQDDRGRYGLSFKSEAGDVWFSLSNMGPLNPDRIKLETWAEEQLSKGDIAEQTACRQ